MINIRIIGLVIFFLTIAFLGVVAVRSANIPAVWQEAIPVSGKLPRGNSKADMLLTVRGNALELSLPDCAIDLYAEHFLLHVYLEGVSNMGPGKFINLDFSLSQEAPERVVRKGIPVCLYKKSFPIQARKIKFGQYDRPNGRCCRILWSRIYYPASKKVN